MKTIEPNSRRIIGRREFLKATTTINFEMNTK